MNKTEIATGNIKPQNKEMEVLKKHFSHCFDKDGNFQFDKFKQSLTEKEVNFSKESYSLDWLGKSYARLLASDAAKTLLKEDTAHNQKEENQKAENLLIKGDNLEVLKHLTSAYYEKIKMIYIDPPYNTGGDGFVYQDDRKFTAEELQELAGIDEERAQRILDFTQSKSNSHSAWLTFMYPRLYVAKQLLREDGVIFISIDDNESAQLRLMLDEIFGEENFVAEEIWQRKTGASDAKLLAIITEKILVYAKSKINLKFNFNTESYNLKRYRYKDEHYNLRGPYYIDNLDRGGLQYSDSMNYGIECPDGTITFPNGRTEFMNDGWTWKWSEKKIKWARDNNFIEFRKSNSKDSGWSVCYKNYLHVNNENQPIERGAPFKNLILNILNAQGNSDIKNLFNQNIFSNPKPVKLLITLLKYIESNCNVLDFFAGSGTTGDAVMQLNAEDGGNRKYILVQLPEILDAKKDKAAYDFVKNELGVDEPTIFEITKERLLRAAKKINGDLDEKNKEIQTEIEKLKAELSTEEIQEKIQELEEEITKNRRLIKQNVFKVFETQPIWEDYKFEAEELDAQTELFDESKLTEEDIQSLLITWKTNDGLELTEDLKSIDLKGYTGYYGQDKLYLMNKGFSTKNLKEILLKIDQDKSFNPTSIIAFGYHFESKNLREIAENVKSYSNKKNVDVDFIIRY